MKTKLNKNKKQNKNRKKLPFPTRGTGPFLFPPFLKNFFHPTQLHGDFSCTFGCLRSFASVQHVICENCYICRFILDVLVRRGEFLILQFHHLNSSPQLHIFLNHCNNSPISNRRMIPTAKPSPRKKLVQAWETG